MQHVAVSSSAISSIGYDPESETMEVTFVGVPGYTGTYHGVPENIFHDWLKAPSIGGYFHAMIRNNFHFTR